MAKKFLLNIYYFVLVKLGKLNCSGYGIYPNGIKCCGCIDCKDRKEDEYELTFQEVCLTLSEIRIDCRKISNYQMCILNKNVSYCLLEQFKDSLLMYDYNKVITIYNEIVKRKKGNLNL